MKLAPFGSDRAAATAGQKEPSPEESLRLVEAFSRIMDPEKQADILTLAELYASGNPKFTEALLKLKPKH